MNQQSVTEKILSYVEANLESSLTLEAIAKEFHYSKFYMERAFKKDTGVSLYRYIRGRRLNEAARKLAESARPVIEIALESGYLSQQAFAQAFRAEYGCTPREYRENGRFMSKQQRAEAVRCRNGVSRRGGNMARSFRFREAGMAA